MALQASELNVGDTHTERLVEDLKRTQIVMYAGASGDYNPVHTDEVFTTKVAGYPSVFAHGMLTMGMAGKMVTNYVRRRQAHRIRCAFYQSGLSRRHARCHGNRGRRQQRHRRLGHLHGEPGRRRGAEGQRQGTRRLKKHGGPLPDCYQRSTAVRRSTSKDQAVGG